MASVRAIDLEGDFETGVMGDDGGEGRLQRDSEEVHHKSGESSGVKESLETSGSASLETPERKGDQSAVGADASACLWSGQ